MDSEEAAEHEEAMPEDDMEYEEEANELPGHRLRIPMITDLQIPESSLPILARNPGFVLDLEDICLDWQKETRRIIENELPTKPKQFTPLSEYELWKERNVGLAILHDQLHSDDVRKVLIVLTEAKSSVVQKFEALKQEVDGKFREARDITRFLGTIERHLKTITYSNSFEEMGTALPHVLESLQLVWMLSRSYNKNERMGTLLQMIASLIYDRVTPQILPIKLFEHDPLTALELVEAARLLFLEWKNCYMNTRNQIAQAGKGAPWEFDKIKLFQKTDYCAVIAQHLSEIAVVLLEFHNFFGPEIKQVVGDGRKVDDALNNAYQLVKPFVEINFDPFSPSTSQLWREMLEHLRKEVHILEAEAKSFIDEAFSNMNVKSSESSFEMLMKFKHIVTRESITARLMKKFDDTLKTYIQELRNIKEYYEKTLEDPPLCKYNPPIAGKIWWVRRLFYHIKGPIIKFRKENDVIGTKVGQLACQEYLNLARSMKNYEDSWYQAFCNSSHKAMTNIRSNIFSTTPCKNELGGNLKVSRNKNVYKVNLPVNVMEAIQEAMNFEQMGYRISETVRNIAFQRNQYIRTCRRFDVIVNYYYSIRRNLRPAETLLMNKCIREVEKSFDQGLYRLTWTALGIPEYALKLTSDVRRFEKVVNEVNKVAIDVRAHLWNIKNANLYLEPPYKHSKFEIPVLDCWDFFQYWERYRNRVFEKLLQQFKGLPPLFLKLEMLISGTSTGKSKQFTPYFSEWEKRIFLYMSKFIIRSLYEFERRLLVKEPLFYVNATLQAPDIRIFPAPLEIYNMSISGALDCITGTKKFVRWMRGTCIETPPVLERGEHEPFVYSYNLDIGRIPRMPQLLLKIEETLGSLLLEIWDHLKKYRKFKSLWRFNKEKTVARFSRTNPSTQLFDEKILFYANLISRVEELPRFRQIGCIRVNMEPLHMEICRHAREWIAKLGTSLAATTKEKLIEMERKVTALETDLFLVPETPDELKKVFAAIHAVQAAAIEIEGRYHDLHLRYADMTLFNIEFEAEEMEQMEETWKRWQFLSLQEIKSIAKDLEPLKVKFRRVTMQNRSRFKTEVLLFSRKYNLRGPGTAGKDYEKGLRLLEAFQEEFSELEKKKQDILLSEMAFGLEMSSYRELGEIKRDMPKQLEYFTMLQQKAN